MRGFPDQVRILFFKPSPAPARSPARKVVLFFKATFKNQPGYDLRAGPKGQNRWMREDGARGEAGSHPYADSRYHARRRGEAIMMQPIPVQQAMAIDRRRVEADLDRIYASSERTKPAFDQWVKQLAEQYGGRPVLTAMKGRERALEKSLDDVRRRRWKSSGYCPGHDCGGFVGAVKQAGAGFAK